MKSKIILVCSFINLSALASQQNTQQAIVNEMLRLRPVTPIQPKPLCINYEHELQRTPGYQRYAANGSNLDLELAKQQALNICQRLKVLHDLETIAYESALEDYHNKKAQYERYLKALKEHFRRERAAGRPLVVGAMVKDTTDSI